MIVIERASDGAEGWTFDGWFLRPIRDTRGALVFDGSDLIDYDPLQPRRWSFDGCRVTPGAPDTILWQLDAGVLSRPLSPRSSAWLWDGKTLAQMDNIHPDVWRATDSVPLLVILFAAGLL